MADAPQSDADADAQAPCDVLILGASFTGIELVYQLRRGRGGAGLRLTIVDRQAQHGYIPLLHERLVGRLDEAATTLRSAELLARDPKTRFVTGEIVGFDPETRTATLASGARLRGRFVVVCLGSTIAAPPAMPGREHLHAIKLDQEFTAAQAALAALLGPPSDAGADARVDAAAPADPDANATDAGADPPRLTVIGGGITGVEMAGELAHLARARPPGWRAPKVALIHGGAALLPGFHPRAAARAERHLRAQGVELLLGHRLRAAAADHLEVADPDGTLRQVPSDMSFWAGGVRPSPILGALGLPRTDAGWLAVGPTLQCYPSAAPSRPGLFAGGDAVRVQSGEGEWPTMQRAIECLWQAKLLARNILTLAGEPIDYPRGVPPLHPHTLRRDFFHGISLGGASLVVFGRLLVDAAALNTWFRRFLMRQYFRRYGQR